MMIFQFIVLQIIVFSAVIFFLKKILYGNTESAIKRLGHVYQDLLSKQAELAQKIEAAEKEYQAKKEEGSAVIDKMKYEALDEMRKKEDEIVKKTRAEAEEIINKAYASRDQFTREIEMELSKKMIDFISGLLHSVFQEKIVSLVHAEMVKDFLVHVKDFDLSSVGSEIDSMVVRTALALKKDESEKLQSLIAAKLNRSLKMEQTLDRNLVAGLAIQFGTLVLDGSLSNSIREAAEEQKRGVTVQPSESKRSIFQENADE